MNAPASSTASWWQSGVIYQVYPRSFQDSNGDGVGDLAGVIARLDYLAWLGVDALWLSPVYPSPMADFGYDVSDYVDIDPIFGSLGDFARLVDLRVPGFGFGHDPVRTPMAWTAAPKGGFTDGEPWLPLHDTHAINAAGQQAEPGSMLTLTRSLIALRRKEPALSGGVYGLIEARGDVLVYERRHETRTLAVLLNLAGSTVYTPLEGAGAILLSTHRGDTHERVGALVRLRPHEGIIVEVSREA